MKEIPLLRGGVTLVDDEDYEWASAFKWRWYGGSVFTSKVVSGRPPEAIILARLLMNAPSHLEVDHKDRNPLNNQKWNLRLATRSQNGANTSKRRDAQTSHFKGVYWHAKDKRWMARIAGTYLGQFKDERQAALTYNTAAITKWGEFALVNRL